MQIELGGSDEKPAPLLSKQRAQKHPSFVCRGCRIRAIGGRCHLQHQSIENVER
jgi:hypothetical protein